VLQRRFGQALGWSTAYSCALTKGSSAQDNPAFTVLSGGIRYFLIGCRAPDPELPSVWFSAALDFDAGSSIQSEQTTYITLQEGKTGYRQAMPAGDPTQVIHPHAPKLKYNKKKKKKKAKAKAKAKKIESSG
jgi:hypothetical protein